MMESPPAMSSAELLGVLRRTPPLPPQGGGGAPITIVDRVQEWMSMGESVFKGLLDSFSDLESREENLRSVSASVEAKLGELKMKEIELKVLHEGKRAALKLRDDELRSREEKLDEQLKLVDEHIGNLEASQSEVDGLKMKELEKLKEIEKRERELEKRLEEFEKSEREFGKRLEEFEKSKREFEGKLAEVALKEEVLERKKAKFADEVRLANEKIMEKQKLGYELIGRLELAVNMLDGLKVIIDGRFKEIESREAVANESLIAKLKEAELIQESLEKRFKELEDFEKEHNFSQEDQTKELEANEGQHGNVGTSEVELRGEESTEQQKSGLQELELQRVNLVSCKKEYDYEGLSCARESAQTCSMENLALSKQVQAQRPSVGTNAGLVADNGQRVDSEIQGSKQPMLTDTIDAQLTTKLDEPIDSKLALNRDLLLQLIHDPVSQKDLEFLGRTMSKILSLSSDPAKLVLEVVEGFNRLGLRILDTERRAIILLLDLLTKLSPTIQPCVEKAAFIIAIQWRLKIKTIAENPIEALAILHLVSAYNLSSRFTENQLFGIIKLAAKHEDTPNLCRTLGLSKKIPGFIQELINEKQYLLASTYISEYQLQHMFSQATILNYYATHSKSSANEKCRSEHNSPAAKEKAIATQIAALRLAIEHITKYRLESDYSPTALRAKIQQLEASQAHLRRGMPPPSPNMQKHGKFNGPQQLSKRARKRLRQEAAMKSSAIPLTPRMAPRKGSNKWHSPGWTPPPQRQSSQTQTRPPPPPPQHQSSPQTCPPPPPQHQSSPQTYPPPPPPQHQSSQTQTYPPPPPPQHQSSQTQTYPPPPPPQHHSSPQTCPPPQHQSIPQTCPPPPPQHQSSQTQTCPPQHQSSQTQICPPPPPPPQHQSSPQTCPPPQHQSSQTQTWPPPQHQSSQTQTCPLPPPPPYHRAPVNLVPMPQPINEHKRPRMNTWMNGGGFHRVQFANQS